MNKYLLQILQEVNTIIIPGLGALTVTSKENGEIMFMSYLKHDDGNLANYISQKEGISENEAKNMISKYVREIIAKIDTGDTFDMYQFGRFIKRDGEIDFESWNSYQHTEDEIAEEKEEPKPEQKVIIEEKISKAEEVLPPVVEKSTSEIKKPLAENNKSTNVGEKKEEIKIDPKENIYIPKEELSKKTEVKKEEKPVLKKDKSPAKKAAKENVKRKPVFWVLTILIVLLVGGGISTALFFTEIKTFFSGNSIENTTPEKEVVVNDDNLQEIENQVALESEQDSIESEEEEGNEEVIKESEENSVPQVAQKESIISSQNTSEFPFHIIIGCFAQEDNANRLAEKYRLEGKKSNVIGKFDNLFFVSYESFSSREEANKILKESGVSGWVFKHAK